MGNLEHWGNFETVPFTFVICKFSQPHVLLLKYLVTSRRVLRREVYYTVSFSHKFTIQGSTASLVGLRVSSLTDSPLVPVMG